MISNPSDTDWNSSIFSAEFAPNASESLIFLGNPVETVRGAQAEGAPKRTEDQGIRQVVLSEKRHDEGRTANGKGTGELCETPRCVDAREHEAEIRELALKGNQDDTVD